MTASSSSRAPSQPSSSWRPIVVGVDASQYAVRAIVWAASEAAQRGVALHLIHALDSAPSSILSGLGYELVVESDRAIHLWVLAQAEDRVRESHPELEPVTEMARQSPAGALVEVSRRAQLLVVGTRGRGGFARLHSDRSACGWPRTATARWSCCARPGTRRAGPARSCWAWSTTNPRTPHVSRSRQPRASTPGSGLCTRGRCTRATQHHISDTDILARLAAQDMVNVLKLLREEYPGVPVKISVLRGHPCAVLGEPRLARA